MAEHTKMTELIELESMIPWLLEPEAAEKNTTFFWCESKTPRPWKLSCFAAQLCIMFFTTVNNNLYTTFSDINKDFPCIFSPQILLSEHNPTSTKVTKSAYIQLLVVCYM
jgi:hypothetical protein